MSVIIDGSAGVTTNAGGSVNPSTNVEGINFSCRAFVNFDGTGTVAIRASGNVSSITDNGSGLYTVNFAIAMPDANYALLGTGGFRDGTNNVEISVVSLRRLNTAVYSTTECAISTSFTGAAGGTDLTFVNVAVLR